MEMGMEVFRRETRNSGSFDNYFRNNIEVFVYTVEKETKGINIFICKRVERAIS